MNLFECFTFVCACAHQLMCFHMHLRFSTCIHYKRLLNAMRCDATQKQTHPTQQTALYTIYL